MTFKKIYRHHYFYLVPQNPIWDKNVPLLHVQEEASACFNGEQGVRSFDSQKPTIKTEGR